MTQNPAEEEFREEPSPGSPIDLRSDPSLLAGHDREQVP